MLLCLLVSAAVSGSCTLEPTACLTASKEDNVKVNETVTFNAACSENATSFNWDFGDNASGDGAQITHKYSSAGTYQVTLTALNGGQSHQSSARIIVIQ